MLPRLAVGPLGLILMAVVLWDAFETIILPRRVTRRFRLARYFYRSTWIPYRALASRMPAKRRERMLSFFGPLSLLMLIGLWAAGLVVSFGLLHFGFGSTFAPAREPLSLPAAIYYSGTTLFTLGLGDIIPYSRTARFLSVLEAGTGFGFLALVIGYFPVLYQAFSRREVEISLLDARAGSPPTAHELLHRNLGDAGEDLYRLFRQWERWSAELMESHLSYPVLCYFRSQHDNTSWLAALTALLDSAAVTIAHTEGRLQAQAQLTFAIARHAVVDLSQTFWMAPRAGVCTRLTSAEGPRLRKLLADGGLEMRPAEEAAGHLEDLRQMYEPYLVALSELLLMTLPPFARAGRPDNWQTSAWGRITAGTAARKDLRHDEHG